MSKEEIIAEIAKAFEAGYDSGYDQGYEDSPDERDAGYDAKGPLQEYLKNNNYE